MTKGTKKLRFSEGDFVKIVSADAMPQFIGKRALVMGKGAITGDYTIAIEGESPRAGYAADDENLEHLEKSQ